MLGKRKSETIGKVKHRGNSKQEVENAKQIVKMTFFWKKVLIYSGLKAVLGQYKVVPKG